MALRSAGMKNCLQACSIVRTRCFRRAPGFQLPQEYSTRLVAADDDEFAELGSPLVSGLRRPVKLMTEKTDRIKGCILYLKKKSNGAHWNSSSACSTDEVGVSAEFGQLHLRGTFSNILDDATDETKAINKGTGFITIANIPPSIKLPKVVEALSCFGKISNSSKQTLQDDNACCDVNFEGGSKPKGSISWCRYCYQCPSSYAICWSCGFLTKLARIDENTTDVVFCVENRSDAKNILKRLNYTVMDDRNCLASLQSSDVAATTSTCNEEDSSGDASWGSVLKTGQQIVELKQLYIMKKVQMEDLEKLHEAIKHIES